MTDIDEIFRASIAHEGDAGPTDVAAPLAGDDPREERAPIDLRDESEPDDVDLLVAEWNEEHADSGSRLAGARDVIAEHIGAHPTESAEAPAPLEDPETVDTDGVPKLSRKDRRRAQREIDRLQRETRGVPLDEHDPVSDDVTILPPSAEVVAAASDASTSPITSWVDAPTVPSTSHCLPS